MRFRYIFIIVLLPSLARAADEIPSPEVIIQNSVTISKDAVAILRSIRSVADAKKKQLDMKSIDERTKNNRKRLEKAGAEKWDLNSIPKGPEMQKELFLLNSALRKEHDRVEKELPEAYRELSEFQFIKQIQEQKYTVADLSMKIITQAIATYRSKHDGKNPESLRDLVPILDDDDSFLTDPWGKPYQYDPKGPKNEGKFPDVWTVNPYESNRLIGNWKKIQ